MSRRRSYVSRRDWHRVGELMPDMTRCPGCTGWQARHRADRSGWCPDCVEDAAQLPLFGIRDALGRRAAGEDR